MSDSSENLSLPTFDTVFEKSYGYMSMLLVALVGIQCQALNRDPFQQHATIMSVFLTATITYAAAFTELKLRPRNNPRLPILRVVCHVSGIVANELLLLILVNPLRCFIINVSAILLVQALCYCNHCVCSLLNLLRICFGWIRYFSRTVEAQPEELQMAELEAPVINVEIEESHQSADVQLVQIEESRAVITG